VDIFVKTTRAEVTYEMTNAIHCWCLWKFIKFAKRFKKVL